MGSEISLVANVRHEKVKKFAGVCYWFGSFGKSKTFMPPHTSENYLQTEMGFVVARRRSKIACNIHTTGMRLAHFNSFSTANLVVLLSVALFAHLMGIFVERWLFFAEARHVVSTYYADITDETSLNKATATSRPSAT